MDNKHKCPKCGHVFEGKLKYCPNCHTKQDYKDGNKDVIDNEPAKTNDKNATKFGWGCLIVVIIVAIIFIEILSH